MNKKESIEFRVEDTMNSLDGLQKAGPGPFFLYPCDGAPGPCGKESLENSNILRQQAICDCIGHFICALVKCA